MARKFWTDEELGLLADRADLTVNELVDLLPERSFNQIKSKRLEVRRGIARPNPSWTAEEDSFIIENSGKLSTWQVAAHLPGRTRVAVKARRRKLDLKPIPAGDIYSPYKVSDRHLLAKTCILCGYLLPGEKFTQRTKNGIWEPQCKFCKNDARAKAHAEAIPRKTKNKRKDAATKKWANKAQAITKMSATRSGYPYLESDFEVLDDPTLTILGKALKIGRTFQAVSSACSERGAKSRGPVAKRDRAKSSWIIDNPNLDNVDEITAMLKEEFAEAGVTFPVWDWDDEDLNTETGATP